MFVGFVGRRFRGVIILRSEYFPYPVAQRPPLADFGWGVMWEFEVKGG
jgi:hypothetical protein